MIKGLFSYFGSKWRLIRQIYKYIPKSHNFLVPFLGSGNDVMQLQPKLNEVWNDINRNIFVLYKCFQEDPDYFHRRLNYTLVHRGLFHYYLAKLNRCDFKHEKDQAFAFLYVMYNSFNGLGNTFSGLRRINDKQLGNSMVNTKHGFLNLVNFLDKIHKRIKYVRFECMDFRELLDLVMTDDCWVIYLDPPYFRNAREYSTIPGAGKPFTVKDFKDLRSLLDKTENRWILTIDNYKFFTRYKNHHVVEIPYYKSTGSRLGKKLGSYSEYLVMNYDPETIIHDELAREPKNYSQAKLESFFPGQ